MKRTVVVGAISVAVIVAVLAVTAVVRGPPKPVIPGIFLVLITWWGIRSAIRRYGSRGP